MKICMPTMGNSGMEERVHNHFGSAGYFTIFDDETNELQVVENNNHHHSHGNCQPLQAISGYNVDAVLTNGMGKRAVQKMNNGGVKVFLLEGDTVAEAIDKFKKSSLIELTIENACGGHHHGHQGTNCH
jgi:predicted Fe-Mo cluster-binding NifX family protein